MNRQEATERAKAEAARATAWWDEARERSSIFNLVGRAFERDQEIGGAMLSAALAFRLFLFQVPLTLVVVGGLGMLSSTGTADPADMTTEAGVRGAMAASIAGAIDDSRQTWWIAMLVGLIALLRAGNSVMTSLVQIHGRSWRVEPKAQQRARTEAMFLALLLAFFAVSGAVARFQDAYGLAGATVAILFGTGVYTAMLCVLSWLLPRRETSWIDLLPGAALSAAVLAAVQFFAQVYLPSKVANLSEAYGWIGVAVALLTWQLVLARIVALAPLVNAVHHEQVQERPSAFDRLLQPIRRRTATKAFDVADDAEDARARRIEAADVRVELAPGVRTDLPDR